MIKVKRSPDADSRTAGYPVGPLTLYKSTQSHITDVKNGMEFIAGKVDSAGKFHDYSKIALFDIFYRDFTTLSPGTEFKAGELWEHHLQERHHLNDSVPVDVNLVDVIEMVVDCCMAGMARSGIVHPIIIPTEVLQAAVTNTAKLIVGEIELVDRDDEDEDED